MEIIRSFQEYQIYRFKDGTPNPKGEKIINIRIQSLFGTSYKDARIKYSTRYLGNL